MIQLSHPYKFIRSPLVALFVYIIPVQVIPVRVHSGLVAGSRTSFRNEKSKWYYVNSVTIRLTLHLVLSTSFHSEPLTPKKVYINAL